jgi:hypothetical protein
LHAPPARPSARERRAKEILAAAEEALTRRKTPALSAVPAAPSKPGVFAWLPGAGGAGPGGPRAGERSLLAYNCGSGPLGFAKAARVHLGFDNWKGQQKSVRAGASLFAGGGALGGLHRLGGGWWVG